MNDSTASTPPVLQMRGIVKEFPGVRALAGVDLDLSAGEVLALVGENGAGKSTLINIIAGLWPSGTYEGELRIDGAPVTFTGPSDALAAGVAVIHQELQLVPDLSVAENLLLGRLPARRGVVNPRELRARAREILGRFDFDVDPSATVRHLSVARRQLVEIARALDRQARILVLDEPSSALTEVETERLLGILRQLRDTGVAIIYITHRLEEVFRVADRITVLRDGQTVATMATVEATRGSVVRAMVGRELTDLYPRTDRPAGEVRLAVRDLTVPPRIPGGRPLVDRLSFDVHEGEVVAIAGLLGAGRTETLLAIFGALARQGEVTVAGRALAAGDIGAAIHAGVALVTEDRKETGLVLDFACRANIALANLDTLASAGIVDRSRERTLAQQLADELDLRPPTIERPARNFSGGNQQKIVLAKWLARAPRVLLLDEPTRGVDVGAKAEIFGVVDRLRSEGSAILMVSSDLLEVLGVADRILVLHQGVLKGELEGRSATQEEVMAMAVAS